MDSGTVIGVTERSFPPSRAMADSASSISCWAPSAFCATTSPPTRQKGSVSSTRTESLATARGGHEVEPLPQLHVVGQRLRAARQHDDAAQFQTADEVFQRNAAFFLGRFQ